MLHERLGRGGMGTVFRASRRDGGPDSAVKLLRGDLADDPNVVARFVQERAIMLELRSDHLVQVDDLVVDDGSVAIVMELVDGGNLRAYLKKHGQVPQNEALELIGQVLDGLTTVHAAGIIHRDLKPENILLTTDGARAMLVKVSDFGIARVTSGHQLTTSSQYLGTPHYAAPELFDDVPPSPATDIYAVGIVLYELLAGATPYAGETPLSVMRKQATSAPSQPPGIGGPLWEMLRHWLAPDPNARPADASAALAELRAVQAVLAGQPTAAPDGPPAAAGSTNAVAAGFVVPPAAPPKLDPAGLDAPTPSDSASGAAFDSDFDADNQWYPTSAGCGGPAAFAPSGVPLPEPRQPEQFGGGHQPSGFGVPQPGAFSPYAPGHPDDYDTDSLTGTPMRDDGTRLSARPPRAPDRMPAGPTPPSGANRTQVWIMLGAAAVLLVLLGSAVYLVAGPAGNKNPRLTFGVERYPDSGAEVTRSWQLVGDHADSVQGKLVVNLTRGGPVDLDEVLPRIMVGASPSITPTPAADTVRPGPDPVFRYHLQGTPGQRVTVSYVTAVPSGPRTVGRLQAWASARNAAAAAYWQEKHQLGALTLEPSDLRLDVTSPPQRLNLTGKQSDGSDAPSVVLDAASWKSADPGVAEVDEHGWVRGVGGGTTDVIATVGKTTAKAMVTVTAPPPPPKTCTPVAPDAPTASVDGTTATVRWRPVVAANCTVSGYEVTASPLAQTQTLSSGSTSVDFAELPPGTYEFTVVAQFGDDGNGPASAASGSVEISCGSVGAPSDIAAQANPSSEGQVDVSWTIPTPPAGCPSPESYVVELDGHDADTYSSTDVSATLSDVSPGRHSVNVIAVMSNGQRIPGRADSVEVTAPAPTGSPSTTDGGGGSN